MADYRPYFPRCQNQDDIINQWIKQPGILNGIINRVATWNEFIQAKPYAQRFVADVLSYFLEDIDDDSGSVLEASPYLSFLVFLAGDKNCLKNPVCATLISKPSKLALLSSWAAWPKGFDQRGYLFFSHFFRNFSHRHVGNSRWRPGRVEEFRHF